MSKIIVQELGLDSCDRESWNVDQDKNYTYLMRKGVHQKIKVTDSLKDIISKYRGGRSSCVYGKVDEIQRSEYYFDPGVKFVVLNNTKNMNTVLYQPKGFVANQDMLLITLAEGYQLMTYQLSEEAEIKSSYHSDGIYGAVITFNGEDELYSKGDHKPVISLQCIKGLGDDVEYVNIDNCFYNGHLHSTETVITDNTKIAVINSVKNRYPNGVGFKMNVRYPVTETYITTVDKVAELTDLLSESRIREPLIYTCNPEDNAEMTKLLTKLQKENGVRAITQYGIEIDRMLIKEAKILYVFILDATGNLKCIKSS